MWPDSLYICVTGGVAAGDGGDTDAMYGTMLSTSCCLYWQEEITYTSSGFSMAAADWGKKLHYQETKWTVLEVMSTVFLQVPLACLGSMAQGSRAGTSVKLWENCFQTSLYSSFCHLVLGSKVLDTSVIMLFALNRVRPEHQRKSHLLRWLRLLRPLDDPHSRASSHETM